MKSDNSDKKRRFRGDKKRSQLKKRFLELLTDEKVFGNVSMAAKILGVNRDTLYDWRAKDVTFLKAWEANTQLANDILSDEAEHALLKAIKAGNVSAIIFTLKTRRPERWNNQHRPVKENNVPQFSDRI